MVPAPWKLVLYGLIILVGSVIALPNAFTSAQLSHWPSWLPSKQLTLGLDLRGGAHMVLEIDAPALRREQLEGVLRDATAALQEAQIAGLETVIETDSVILRADTPSIAAAARGVLESQNDGYEIEPDAAPTIIRLAANRATMAERERSALQQSIEIVRRRIDAVGVAEPTVQALGTDRILVQLPGVQDSAAIRTLLGSTAKLTFHRVQSSVAFESGALRAGAVRAPSAEGDAEYVIDRRPLLQGERLVKANASMDSQTGLPTVSFQFDAKGAQLFAAITREHVGRQLAIVLDGKVISAPVIQEPILGGTGQIQGDFSVAETSSLATLLRAGALPVPLEIIEERMVGPDLGSDAIRMGAMTGAIGLLLVLIFMTVLYRGWGMVANFALLTNVALTLAALTLLEATLTLPGIAGIVLGIGLAVDANVLINERIREETRKGKSAVAALTSGFQRAYATVLDSNTTALIATLLLFWFGSGPVRGFAVTMALGILISMFTAVAVVRALMALWVHVRRPRQFHIGTLLPARWRNATPQLRVMRTRFIGIGASLALSIGSVFLLVNPGLNYGVDFTGGSFIEVTIEATDEATAPASMRMANVRESLEQAEVGDVSLQQIKDASTLLVRLQQQPSDGLSATAIAERAKAAILQAEPQATFNRVDIVGPKISSELADTGILAVLFASVAMFIYIAVRFDRRFAVGAIATLALDTTKVLGFFALTGLEFNLTAIAALLTLIGYSVNDKVVVYDRMRENLALHPQEPLRELIDRSIDATVARSVFTSLTALLAMLPMALVGGVAVSSFAIPMVFGIVVAASSSVFVAAPLLLFLGARRNKARVSMNHDQLRALERAP